MRVVNESIYTEVLQPALEELKKRSGVTVKYLPVTDPDIDANLEINFRKTSHQFYVEVRGEVRQNIIETVSYLFGSQKEHWLLVAKYIPAPLKDHLRSHGYNYLEATGNCYIQTGDFLIHINDQEVKHVRSSPTGKLWKPAGLKFMFVVLQDPSMLTKPYRTIAQAAGIASGNISALLKEVTALGYEPTADPAAMRITRGKLLDRWAEIFEVALKPKLVKGSYYFVQTQQEGKWADFKEGVYWTGEPGADIYTNFLVPETFAFYTDRTGNELVKQMKIAPKPTGNIIVLDKFWDQWPGDGSSYGAAPPLLVYADLKNNLDSRIWETAEKIKKMILNDD